MARVLLAGLLGWLPLSANATASAHEAQQNERSSCADVRSCRSEIARLHSAVVWQRDARRALEHRLRVRFLRDLGYAARLAAVTYAVPAGELRAVAACESKGDLHALNRSSGAAGPMQFLPSTWRRNAYGRAGFSVDDPVAALLGAARVVRADRGWSEWVCRP